MLRTLSFALQAIAIIGLFAMTAPAFAGGPAGAVQLAFHENSQTAALPAGRISLRVIERVGGPTLKVPIKWRIMTYGRDDAGRRHQIAELTGSTVELVLPAAWYIVYAQLPDRELRHPVEVTAGKSFKYTLVKK
ncbi:MAG: hypothetical protein IID48_07500 [Proteobacteria bacterium]|nr:hypothetical protein [Pseudomonadota bacterium]